MSKSLTYTYIGLCGFLLLACQPKPQIINQFHRKLTPQEIENLAQESESEVIATKDSETQTFILWDSQVKGLSTGYYSAHVIELDNNQTSSYINKSTYNAADNPQKKVSISISEIGHKKIGESKPEASFHHGEVAIVIRDSAILQQMESAKLTFKDQQNTVVPSQGKKGILFQYDSSKRDCCSKIELLSKSGKALYSTNCPF